MKMKSKKVNNMFQKKIPQDVEIKIYNKVLKMTSQEVVKNLINIVGTKFTAYFAGINKTSTLKEWIRPGFDGDRPSTDDLNRMRDALHISKFIATYESKMITCAWLGGMNPELGDRNPAELIRNGKDHAKVLHAAYIFIDN